MRAFIYSWLFLAFTTGYAAAADLSLDRPSMTVTPAQIRLSELLAKHDAAVGAAAPKPVTRESWTYVDTGVHGTETLVRSGRDYHSVIKEGPFTDEYGQHDDTRWHRDRAGYVVASLATEDRSFVFNRVLEDAADPKNDARVLGRIESPVAAYVVEVKVSGSKHPEWVFYDAASSLIDRVEYISRNRRVTSVYDDYRATQGRTLPWHIHDTYDKRAWWEDDYRRTSLEYLAAAPPHEFQPPVLAASGVHVAQPTVLTNTNLDTGDAIVRVTINGRGLDFEVDSSTNETVIDHTVAKQLGLPAFGAPTEGGGEAQAFTTVVPVADVGGLLVHDVTMRALPFYYHADPSTKVVGLLGYDFLRALNLKIDYVNKTLTALPPTRFEKYVPAADSMVLPVKWDDGRPLVTITIGGKDADSFIFDTDSEPTVIMGGVRKLIPESFPDFDDQSQTSALGLVTEDSVGLRAHIKMGRLGQFILGKANFGGLPILYTDYDYAPAGHSMHGILGQDFLHFFDITFDYAHDRIILDPNKYFFKVFEKPAPPKP